MADRYQGFHLDSHPGRDPSRRATSCVVWARTPDEDPVFGIAYFVTDTYARRQWNVERASESQACALAVEWVHGLIDTQQWERSDEAKVIVRTTEWDSARNDEHFDESSLRAELLRVFARMERVGTRVDYAPRLDVAGFAEVLGVDRGRVRATLAELATRRWIEPYGYESRPEDGNARITARGYEALDREDAAEETAETDPPSPPAIQVILFTDIVGSTGMQSRLGDEAARKIVRQHDVSIRVLISEHGGREVKHTGDGTMAAFGSAERAVQCALRLKSEIERYSADNPEEATRVRFGLNAGEPIAEDGDFFGLSVTVAARLADWGEAGRVLVTDVVRQLLAGKGFRFEEVGRPELQGILEPVSVYEVRAAP